MMFYTLFYLLLYDNICLAELINFGWYLQRVEVIKYIKI